MVAEWGQLLSLVDLRLVLMLLRNVRSYIKYRPPIVFYWPIIAKNTSLYNIPVREAGFDASIHLQSGQSLETAKIFSISIAGEVIRTLISTHGSAGS